MSETAAQYEKLPCRICGGALPEDYLGSVCRGCLGFEDEEDKGCDESSILKNFEGWREALDVCVCPDCGEEFQPWRNGRFLVVARCKKCLTSKRVKTVKAVWAKNGGKKPGGRHKKSNQVQSEETKDVKYVWSVGSGIMEPANPNTVTLDFTAAPEVLAWIQLHHDNIPGHIMGLIVLEIPTDVCKRWVLDRLMGGR
jgi:hypothetical protein